LTQDETSKDIRPLFIFSFEGLTILQCAGVNGVEYVCDVGHGKVHLRRHSFFLAEELEVVLKFLATSFVAEHLDGFQLPLYGGLEVAILGISRSKGYRGSSNS